MNLKFHWALSLLFKEDRRYMIDYEKNNKYAKHVLNLIILSTALFTSTLSLKQNVEVIDLVVTSALARKL
jgi:hypothetical protein